MTTWRTTAAITNITSTTTTATDPTQNCTHNSASKLVSLDPAFMTYYYGSVAVVALLSVTGNLLVLRTISRHRCLWLPGNVFICSLALSDLLFAFIFPVYTVAGINRPAVHAAFGDWSVCRVVMVEVIAMELCSAYALVGITATRYICSQFPLRHHCYVTHRKCLTSVVVIWVTSHITCVTVYGMRNPWAVSTERYCRVCRYETMFTVRELGVLTVLQFGLPFTLMLVFYLRMACMAWKLNSRVAIESVCSNGARGDRRSAILNQRRHKSFVVVTFLVGCFALSYMLVIVYFFLIMLDKKPRTQYEYLSATCRIFLFLNTAVNVLIYAGRMTDFREFLRRDLRSCRLLPSCCRRFLATSADASTDLPNVVPGCVTSPPAAPSNKSNTYC